MANRPTNVSVRADLTQYAFGIMQDLNEVRRIAGLIAPVVPTGGTSGKYNKFDTASQFKAYSDAAARRSIGGHATEIGLLNDTANYNCEPYGLRIKIDQTERDNAGAAVSLLEQAKTRTLMINCAIAYLNGIMTAVAAAVTATAGKGAFSGANTDPIEEIDSQILAVRDAVGVTPNVIMMDLGAWAKFKNNPKVKEIFKGITANIQPAAAQGMFLNPNARLEIIDISVLTGGGLGNSGATRASIIGSSCYIFYSSPFATPYDPSFCKTFAPSANLFTEVYSYREEPHFDWFENDWSCQPVVVSSALCKRLTVN